MALKSEGGDQVGRLLAHFRAQTRLPVVLSPRRRHWVGHRLALTASSAISRRPKQKKPAPIQPMPGSKNSEQMSFSRRKSTRLESLVRARAENSTFSSSCGSSSSEKFRRKCREPGKKLCEWSWANKGSTGMEERKGGLVASLQPLPLGRHTHSLNPDEEGGGFEWSHRSQPSTPRSRSNKACLEVPRNNATNHCQVPTVPLKGRKCQKPDYAATLNSFLIWHWSVQLI